MNKLFLFLTTICLLTSFGFQQRTRGCFVNGGFTDLGETSMTTGNQQLDFAAQQEVDRLRGMFGVSAQFYFMRENGAPNAYATTEVSNQSRPDGTVLFGLKLHESEMPKSIGGTTIPMIMAHEFGHILAFKRNMDFGGKYDELWADYCAGAYMYYRRSWKSTDVNATLKSFFDIGDYAYNSPSHHGTPNERYAAVVRGFMDADSYQQRGVPMTLEDLINSGSSYINSLK